MTNLARRGPKKVWSGYKTMRVPEEIFDDVKKFMERRKQIYLAEQEGIELEEKEIPHSDKYSIPGGTSKEEIKDIIRETLREELRGGSSGSQEVVEIPPAKLTSKEKVEELLKNKPGEMLATTQISAILDLPNSTTRQATRELAEEDARIRKIGGRPNKFIFEP